MQAAPAKPPARNGAGVAQTDHFGTAVPAASRIIEIHEIKVDRSRLSV
jgi:hypothetical protein